MAQCEHRDDEGVRCPYPGKFDVRDSSRLDSHGYAAEWEACEEHARECRREGCHVEGLEDEEEVA